MAILQRQTPLQQHYACKHGQAEAVKFLLAQGATPNVVNSQGWTALNIARGSGKTDCVYALLEARADPNIPRQCNLFPIYSQYIGAACAERKPV